MNKAIILYGPSGAGKSKLASEICFNFNFLHCDTDKFQLIYSNIRSKLRSMIASKTCFTYAKELIKTNHNIVIEAIQFEYIDLLKELLEEFEYEIFEISLKSSLQNCIKNDLLRIEKKLGENVIKEVYNKYDMNIGLVINVETEKNILKKVIEYCNLKKQK